MTSSEIHTYTPPKKLQKDKLQDLEDALRAAWQSGYNEGKGEHDES